MTDFAQLHAQAIGAFNRHDWPHVLALAPYLLSMAPSHAATHYMTGVAYLEQCNLSRALPHLQRATELEPANIEFAARLARALANARLGNAAKAVAERVMALEPQDAATLDLVGTVYAETGAPDQAVLAFRRAATLAPNQPVFRYNLATALITIGQFDAAEREIETCLTQNPLFWRAHLAMAHLHRQSPTRQHLARLQTLLEQHDDDRDARLCLNLALAKGHEDLGDYPQAFRHLAQGKQAAKEMIDYSSAQDEAIFAALLRTFPDVQAPGSGSPSTEPIFVFGMPRSGTTLVERILTSHPDVHGAGELQNFGMTVGRAWNSPTPFWLDPAPSARVRNIDWPRLGTNYLASTRPDTGHTPHFVDKFPFNFLYAGFIARALPNAKMICLRRHPMDTCLGNFRQMFGEKLPYYHFSFDLLDIGRYYILFDRLMAHWRKVLPGRILEVDYESLVATPESTIRQLLAHCNLPWHDDCLHFEHNPAPVITASALQVRKPMFHSSVGRWKRYASELEGLRSLLHDAGIDTID